MLSIEQGYYVVYKFLEHYWMTVDKFVKYKNADFSLVTVISTMSPGEMNNPNPVDFARYVDWKSVISDGREKNVLFEETDVYSAMISYLKFYAEEFEFNLRGAIADIEENFALKYSTLS